MNTISKGRISALAAAAALSALCIASPVSASAATGADCNVSASIVGNVLTPAGTVGFPAEADHAVVGYDMAAAGGQNASIDPVFDGPITGDPFEFQPFDLIGGFSLPALPATITVNWTYYIGYGTPDEVSFSGTCPVVNVTDANPTTPPPVNDPKGVKTGAEDPTMEWMIQHYGPASVVGVALIATFVFVMYRRRAAVK